MNPTASAEIPNPERPADPESADPVVRGLTCEPSDLVSLAQGLSCWLWGIPTAVLLSVRRLPFEWEMPFHFPLFVFPYLLVLVGTAKLLRVRSPGERWHAEIRKAFHLCLAVMLLAPFLYWWRYGPGSLYITVNLWILIFAGIAFLAQVNRVIHTLGAYLGDPALAAEAELFRLLVWVLLGLPVAVSIVRIVFGAVRSGENVADFFASSVTVVPPWALGILLVPLSISLALVWRAKDIVLGNLRNTPLP